MHNVHFIQLTYKIVRLDVQAYINIGIDTLLIGTVVNIFK